MAFVPTKADVDKLDKKIASKESYQRRFYPTASDYAQLENNAAQAQDTTAPVSTNGVQAASATAPPVSSIQPMVSEPFSSRLENIVKSLGHHAAMGLHSDANFVRGIRDSITNLGVDTANVIPGVNINKLKTAEGPAYEVGKIAGNVAGFMGGGEGLETARLGSESLPYVGNIAKALSGNLSRDIIKRGIGTSLYGAITNPESRLKGAGEGALFSGLSEFLPVGSRGIGKVTSLFKPKQKVEQLMDLLNPEASSEQGNKSAAQAVQDAYLTRIRGAHELYSPVLDSVGNHPIYDQLNPGRYNKLGEDVFKSYDKNVNAYHNKFVENPTFENAHKLRRQINHNINELEGALKKRGYSIAESDALHNLKNASSSLNSDMMNFLDNKQPVLSNQFRRANQYWRTHAVPYQANNKLYKLASGAIKNPKSLVSIFSHPEDETLKVIEDLPEHVKHKILYEKLGKQTIKKDPEKILSAYDKLEEQGLGEYVTPSVIDQIESLQGSIGRKKGLQRTAGLGVGALLAHSMGPDAFEAGNFLPGLLEAGAAGLGAVSAPQVFRGIERNLPIENMADVIRSASRKSYPFVSKAALAQIGKKERKK